MVIGHIELQATKHRQEDKAGDAAENSKISNSEQGAYEQMYLDSLPILEAKFRGGGFSGAGRAIGRSAGSMSRAGKGIGDAAKSAPKIDAPKVDAPKIDAPKVNAPRVDAPKVEAPKGELPKTDASKVPVVPEKGSVPSIDGRKNIDATKPALPASREISRAPDLPPSCTFLGSLYKPWCIGYWFYGLGSGSSKARAAGDDCSKIDQKDQVKVQACQLKKGAHEIPFP